MSFASVDEQRLELTETMLLGYTGEAAERRTDLDAIPHAVRETLEARGYEIVADAPGVTDGGGDTVVSPTEARKQAGRIEELATEREVEVRLSDEVLREALQRYLASDSESFEDFALDYVTLAPDWRTADGTPINPDGGVIGFAATPEAE